MKRVDADMAHRIIRHHLVDNWPIGTVARELRVHHDVVRRVLRQHTQAPKPVVSRRRKRDPYLAFIERTLLDYPKLHASRLHQMVCQRGYQGSESHFRRLISTLRPRPVPEPFARLVMTPGEQAQVDGGHFGTREIGRAKRPLLAFVMTLSWSRMVWLQFFHDMRMANFQNGHVSAFDFFGGVPRCLLYDNLKSAVVERVGPAIRFNDQLLELASYYGFEPRAAAPRRGNEKGRVERTIRYIRTNFFAARDFDDVHDLNAQAVQWSLEVSAQRRWPDDDRLRVGPQFKAEQTSLRPLPPTPFEAWERLPARVGRTPFVRFDTNDYSLPATHTRREVLVQANHRHVLVLVDGDCVARHVRCYDRRNTHILPEHHKDLLDTKRRAQKGAGMHRLTQAAPEAQTMLKRAAERGHNLGPLTAKLLELLDLYGPKATNEALEAAGAQDRVGFRHVRLLLEQNVRQKGTARVRPLTLKNKALKNLTVSPVNLNTYDRLMENDDA